MPREKPDTGVVGAVAQSGALQRLHGPRGGVGEAVQPAEEHQVLARSQLGIEEQVVAEHADARAEARRRPCRRCALPYFDRAVGGREQRGQDGEQRGLAGAVRAEQADDLAGLAA